MANILKDNVIFYFLFFLRFFADFVATVYAMLLWPDQRNKLPPIRDDLLMKPVSELVEDIKSRKLTCKRLTQTYLNRIEEVNKFTNSVVELNPNAIAEAEKIDDLIANTKDKSKLDQLPLLGIPFTAKDSVCIKGLALTIGMVSRKNKKADKDSEVIVNLRNAGAIPLAITNVPQCLLWYDAHNYVTGRTNNPYDLSRIPGGSTGGCASLVASAASPFSLASDIGGSTRIPANFCGCFGHKTTAEVISSKGKYPEVSANSQPYRGYDKKLLFSFGPISRFSTDLRLSIYGMAGKDAIEKKLPKLFDKVEFKNLKIYYMLDDKDPFKTRVIKEIRSAIVKTANHFSSTYGSATKEVYFDKIKNSLAMWSALLCKLSERSFTAYMKDFPEDGSEVNVWVELLKALVGRSEHTITSIVYAINDKLKDKNSPSIEKYIDMIDELKKELTDLLKDDAVLIFPTYPDVAEKHQTTILKAHNVAYTALFNILSFPATQCPFSLCDQTGMPIGFQVVATPYNDHLTLSVAEEIERVFGGWRAPCKIEI